MRTAVTGIVAAAAIAIAAGGVPGRSQSGSQLGQFHGQLLFDGQSVGQRRHDGLLLVFGTDQIHRQRQIAATLPFEESGAGRSHSGRVGSS